MRFAQIRELDIANGIGVRCSLYVQGCHRHCKNCFNQETWDFNGGQPFDQKQKDALFNVLSRPHIQGITILGGEPLEKENRADIAHLIEEIHFKFPQKTIWMYSSFLYEEILTYEEDVLKYLDVLIDGPFIEELKDLRLKFKGSSNQRIIDVQKSLQNHEVVLYTFKEY